MRLFKSSMLAAFALAISLGTASAASAATAFDNHHPRRAEVTERILHQNHRIHRELREGKLTARQAHRLHHADRSIARHERMEARLHHGHLTKAEQHALDHRLDRTGKRIGG